MVIPCAAVGAGASAGATALGLSMGKSDLEQTRELFKLQMRQSKRLWTADWAENSVRHGEACLQAAHQHAESQALSMAAYYQAEKLASQGIKLARDQDSRSYEMAWRAEVRESLRDELTNQNNRFNIVMLCDTVCLGCVFTLVADGAPPLETRPLLIHFYVGSLGLSIMLFSISLWCAVVVVRRLHEQTAGTLERKLFAQSEDLKVVWHRQLQDNQPTGPEEMQLVNQAYEKWVATYLDPIGRAGIQLMAIGVVVMFITAGQLVHHVYTIEYDVVTAVAIFWACVLITSATVLLMKFSEDRKEKRKEGVYDNSWQDNAKSGPFAKVSKAAHELSNGSVVRLGSVERMESMGKHERVERDACVSTSSLHERVSLLRQESTARAKMRKDVLQLLTTAAEELDALPEDLTSNLNKVLHSIDEADARTANLIQVESEKRMLRHAASHGDWSRLSRRSPGRRQPMALHPLDAQRIPVVSMGSLRKKLGEISLTTVLRLKNLSDEPLRLKSGVQLSSGKYIQSIKVVTTDNNQENTVYHHLYPGTEIPPRTEVLIAARSNGKLIPTSGIEGEIVYTNIDESWQFKISFRNSLIRNVRNCRVQASLHHHNTAGGDDASSVGLNGLNDGGHDEAAATTTNTTTHWQISKEELDQKANNEIAVSIDKLRGEEATRVSFHQQQSQTTLKSGYLYKNNQGAFGMKLQWQQRWFVLTPLELLIYYSQKKQQQAGNQGEQGGGGGHVILKNITNICVGTDMVRSNVFEIHSSDDGTSNSVYRISAASPEDRDAWMRAITDAAGITSLLPTDSSSSFTTTKKHIDDDNAGDGIECVEHQDARGTEVLPPTCCTEMCSIHTDER